METYDNKNVGTTHVMTVTPAVVNDGNGGANYNVTYNTIATGIISQKSITVTAGFSSKTYDGLLTSTGTPTITSGTLVSGDSGTWLENYDNKNVGTAHVMTPSGTVKDGSSNDMTANYNITFTPISTGIISQRSVTVTAGASSKTYDGLLTSTGTPTVTTGTLAAGDSGNWVETYDNKNVGTSHVMTPSGTVKDGSSNDMTANYNITFTHISTGIISQRPITVTAGASSKVYDGNTTSPGIPTITSGTLIAGDTAPTWVETYDNKNVGNSHVMTVTPAVMNDGNGGANYNITYNTIATGIITPGLVDAGQSTLTPTSASITANGTSTQTLTVQAKDANGNNLTTGGAAVVITKSLGTGSIGSVTDNSDGTYTATVTAPIATGSGVFVATLGGSPVQSGTGSQTQSTITYIAGTASKLAFTGSAH